MKRKTTEPCVLVTFHTTAEAMQTEMVCKEAGVEGRLISAPRALTADCGIAWRSPVSAEEALRKAIGDAGIEIDAYPQMEY